jgi:hypothetical protein
MKLNKLIYWVALLISLSLLLLPKLLPICEVVAGKPPMRCFYTYQAEFLMALLAVIIASGLFFAKEAETKKFIGSFLFILGIIILILPEAWAIGLCSHGDSACHSTTHWITGASILLSLSGVASSWQATQESTKDEDE